jgi:hypothetical protein
LLIRKFSKGAITVYYERVYKHIRGSRGKF